MWSLVLPGQTHTRTECLPGDGQADHDLWQIAAVVLGMPVAAHPTVGVFVVAFGCGAQAAAESRCVGQGVDLVVLWIHHCADVRVRHHMCRRCVERQAQAEPRAGTWFGVDLSRAAVCLGDARDDRQAEP